VIYGSLFIFFALASHKQRRIKLNIDDIFLSYGISPIPKDYTETMAYVPYQSNNPKFYSVNTGFEAGTIFPTLNKPFYGSKCGEDEND
jgi:hypothetical protein